MSKNENLKVAVRIRPTMPSEFGKETVVFCDDHKNIQVTHNSNLVNTWYDHVFDSTATNLDVFDWAQDSVQSVVHGINVTLFAYGQTGSGKTHSMFGSEWDQNEKARQFRQHSLDDPTTHGIIPRSVDSIFQDLQVRDIGKYTVLTSFIQIYNEKIFDLLMDDRQVKPLSIREDTVFGIYVEGLSEYVVQNTRDCVALIKRGDRNRAVRATRMNTNSSRSHTIFQILIESDKANRRGNIKKAKLNLWDLAGSEKFDKDGAMNSNHVSELKRINLSLTNLGKVISSLSRGGKQHIPYRDSLLTRLLQDSLGGNTKTVFIATVSPIRDCVDETVSTLKFADRAKKITVSIRKNEISATNDKLVQKLLREVQHLKQVLNLKKQGGPIKEFQDQLWILREENQKLKQAVNDMTLPEVEQLKQENKQMRLQLQRVYENNSPNVTSGSFSDYGSQLASQQSMSRFPAPSPLPPDHGAPQPINKQIDIISMHSPKGSFNSMDHSEYSSKDTKRSGLSKISASSSQNSLSANKSRFQANGRNVLVNNASQVEIRIRGKYNTFQRQQGSLYKSTDQLNKDRQRREEWRAAQQRLKKLEQIELYREKVANAQIEKLMQDRKIHEENQAKKIQQTNRRNKYFSIQSKRLDDYNQAKERREKAEADRRKKQSELERLKHDQKRFKLKESLHTMAKRREKEVMDSI